MNVGGAAGCSVVYKNMADTEAEDGFGSESITSNNQNVKHTVTPSTGGVLEIIIKMGTVLAGNSVTVNSVKIEQLQYSFPADSENLMSFPLRARPPVNFWAHEGYNATVSNTDSSATLTVNTAPDSGKEGWKVKLFVETGIALAAGKDYRISADVSASAATNYEICYNNGRQRGLRHSGHGQQYQGGGADVWRCGEPDPRLQVRQHRLCHEFIG